GLCGPLLPAPLPSYDLAALKRGRYATASLPRPGALSRDVGQGGNLHDNGSHPANRRIIGPTRGTAVPAQKGTGATPLGGLALGAAGQGRGLGEMRGELTRPLTRCCQVIDGFSW